MIIKTLIATATIMIAVTADGSSTENTGHIATLQTSATTSPVPGSEQIRTDLIGHRMFVSEGLPGIWEFADPAGIQRVSINSSRLRDDSMEFTVTLFLVDNASPTRDIYRAETLITYTRKNATWDLVAVQDLSFTPAGAAYSIVTGSQDADC